jgi:hypothetical protein
MDSLSLRCRGGGGLVVRATIRLCVAALTVRASAVSGGFTRKPKPAVAGKTRPQAETSASRNGS